MVDKQRVILLDVRQGESPIGSENLGLGKLEIAVEPKPAGEAGVEVRFTYDANGLLGRSPNLARWRAARAGDREPWRLSQP